MTDDNNLAEKLNIINAKKINIGNIITTILLIVLAVIMLVIAYLNTCVFFLVEVSGESMLPTLNSGDVVFVNKKLVAEREAIIIIDGEKSNSYLIKRVIATGGDTVEIKDGYVFINGEKLEEEYVIKDGVTNKMGEKSKWALTEDEIFYLGDNRINSRDSRDDEYGTCKVEQIVGVVEEWSIEKQKLNRFLYSLGR